MTYKSPLKKYFEGSAYKKDESAMYKKSHMYKDKSPMYGHKSHMYKLDPPETQTKIKKMILSGIDKGKSDKEIMKNINSMSSGDIEYTYNRDKKQVKTRKINTGGMGFEGEEETDPDKG